jgi:hypothetical protein
MDLGGGIITSNFATLVLNETPVLSKSLLYTSQLIILKFYPGNEASDI